MPLGRYYLQHIPMVYKGLAGWLTSEDYSFVDTSPSIWSNFLQADSHY